MSGEKLRVGIIGANYTLIAHSHAWRALPGVEIGAVCTAHQETAEAAAKEYGIPKFYCDYRKMAEDPDLDIITVGTKPSQRFDMVMTALENGKHVYNCLPFATNVEQARAMRDKQWERGVVGTGIALRLAAEGAIVVVHGRNCDRGEKVVAEITGNGQCHRVANESGRVSTNH